MRQHMLRIVLPALLLGLLAAAAAPAQSPAGPVGLGAVAGLAFPSGATAEVPNPDNDASFNWGFFVNIPIISTLHLTPSAELYRLGGTNATDFDLAVKLIVPLQRFDLYAGLVPGLTAVSDVTAPHVGVLGGASFPLVGNLDLYVQAKYNWIFQGGQNLRVLHANTGILFIF